VPELSTEAADFVRNLVIYEDDKVIVFNKPSGLAVQGGGGISRSLDDLLVAFAKSNGKRPRLVHRLDLGTSGVIITARTQPAAAFLSEEFASRRTEKTYLALVRGALPSADEGNLNTPLVKVEEAGRPRMIAAKPGRKGAQAAVTHWRILTRSGDAALLEARPETGRMHQIRAHLSIAGMPILGIGFMVLAQKVHRALCCMLRNWLCGTRMEVKCALRHLCLKTSSWPPRHSGFRPVYSSRGTTRRRPECRL
jgi:23S rRNA pseudouridine955/2504/2580 synthase